MAFIQGFHPNIGVRNKPNIESFEKAVRKVYVI